MADKMFYTLEEAADRLGKSEDEVREMAGSGELQQFRDREKLMFKVEHVEAIAGGGTMADSMGLELSDTGTTFDLADSAGGDMTLADSSGDSLGLGDSSSGTQADSLSGSGVDVFSPGEVEAADPMDQTQVTSPQVTDDEVQLDSVGSGSGLLDLTRESDETSLGAELDEIFPGGETAAGASGISESAVGSSGVFESGMGETGASGPSGLENLAGAGATGAGPAMAGGSPVMARSFGGSAEDELDPAWSGFTTGAMLGVLIAVVIGLIVAAGAIAGVSTSLTAFLTGSAVAYWGVMAGLLILAFVLGAVGMVIGKASAK
ncbi:MAG: helix-turn-helix domain-containing protein [Planctomycetota bacterium]